MTEPAHGSDLIHVVVLLGAAVVAIPIFKRLGLGSVLGYLAAGLVIGPFGLGLFSDPEAILHVAELGVVMFLFVIGLEMQPSRLWSLRREIFGLGLGQVLLCGALLTTAGMLLGYGGAVAFVAAMGFVLSSTAIVMQILEERGETSKPSGQRIVSILLLEDLSIVPLLAIVAFLAPVHGEGHGGSVWLKIATAIGSVAVVVVVGRWLLNPLFRILANAKAREVLTAAALLVVLGAALLMQWGGLSMAMGAFLAGVLLSESTFRHQLEADIEPFRGLLLGLFFLGVGMSLDLAVVAHDWQRILLIVAVFMLVKAVGVYALARALKSSHAEALTRAALLIQGGEFAFVLYAAAAGAGIFEAHVSAILSAAVILSMALTPLVVMALRWLIPKRGPSMDGVDIAEDLSGSVLLVGFGRFGQIVSQSLLARGFAISIIETDTTAIRDAKDFGFKVYYGDGSRPDVLHAAGAETARAILICINDKAAAIRAAEIVKAEFPHARLLVRSLDREHSLELVATGVDFQIRETFESAMAFGEAALRALGLEEIEAAEVVAEVRRRDAQRFDLEVVGGIYAGRSMIHGNLAAAAPTESGGPVT
ncbi:MAG: monovalent cation:proton antiporter-2 (CPA2) family protein [Burkholderiales bacterium]|nr:monovalent cation:proton antiporter-2 (CPA2) family protein [Burkholderiales bacterium]